MGTVRFDVGVGVGMVCFDVGVGVDVGTPGFDVTVGFDVGAGTLEPLCVYSASLFVGLKNNFPPTIYP